MNFSVLSRSRTPKTKCRYQAFGPTCRASANSCSDSSSMASSSSIGTPSRGMAGSGDRPRPRGIRPDRRTSEVTIENPERGAGGVEAISDRHIPLVARQQCCTCIPTDHSDTSHASTAALGARFLRSASPQSARAIHLPPSGGSPLGSAARQPACRNASSSASVSAYSGRSARFTFSSGSVWWSYNSEAVNCPVSWLIHAT